MVTANEGHAEDKAARLRAVHRQLIEEGFLPRPFPGFDPWNDSYEDWLFPGKQLRMLEKLPPWTRAAITLEAYLAAQRSTAGQQQPATVNPAHLAKSAPVIPVSPLK